MTKLAKEGDKNQSKAHAHLQANLQTNKMDGRIWCTRYLQLYSVIVFKSKVPPSIFCDSIEEKTKANSSYFYPSDEDLY